MRRFSLMILSIFIMVSFIGCDTEEITPETPNTMPPSIMVDGQLYYSTFEEISIEPDESVIKTVTSVIDITELPSKEGEINLPFPNAKFAKINDYEEYVVVLMDLEWIKFEKSGGNWGLELTATNVSPTGLTLLFNQSGGNPSGDLQTGSYYIIETYNGSGWLPVDYKDNEIEVAWTDEAWIIPMNDTVEWKVDWEWLYGNLPNGKYRIGKEIMDFRDTGDYDEKTYYANFKINGSIEILDNQAPDIIEVSFTNLSGEDLLKDGWFTVGEDNKLKINIKVKGNCTSVDMFIKPTGTDAYTSQKMVDSLVGGPGENQFEYIWDVPEGTMSHFWIIAYNGDIGQRSKPFNIYNDY